MDIVTGIMRGVITSFLRGLVDSLRGFPHIFLIDKDLRERQAQIQARISPRRSDLDSRDQSPIPFKDKKGSKTTVISCMTSCLKMNGFLILIQIIFYNFFIDTVIKDWLGGVGIATFLEYFSIVTYGGFLFAPVFAVTKFVNAISYQDISNLVHKASGRRSVSMGLSNTIADFVFSSLIEVLFQIQASLMLLIPFWPISTFAYLAHRCLLFSLYAFEYKWFEYGWGLNKRLTFIGMYWPYFIGFGLWLELATQISDSIIISGGVFGILFPILIVSSFKSVPVTESSPVPLPVFKPVIVVTDFLCTILSKFIHKKSPSSQVSTPVKNRLTPVRR